MSLYADFMAAVEHAATQQRCNRGFHHQPHDTTTGRCPGLHVTTLPADQTKRLADNTRQHIHNTNSTTNQEN